MKLKTRIPEFLILKRLFPIILLFMAVYVFPQGAAINTTGAAGSPSAILDLSSSNQGFVMPRMTTSERNLIQNPVTGLMIYNTDCNNFDYFNGSIWVAVNSINAGAIITANPAGAICAGTGVAFSVNPLNGGNAPAYQWYINSLPLTGETGQTYYSNTLNNGDVVTCEVTSNAPCVVGSPVVSNPVTMVVNPVLGAGVSISANPSGTVCPGQNIVFTATPVNGGSSPSYQWKVNGGNVGSGGTTYSSSSLNNSDIVTCEMLSNLVCVTGSPALSNQVTIVYGSAPATPGSISGDVSPCINSTSNSYSISAVSGATNYVWTVPSGAYITAGQGTTSITVTFGSVSGDITVKAENACGVSNPNTLTVNLLGSSGSQTFSYTGSSQTFVVPTCVTSLTIQAWGAEGGVAYSGGVAGYGGYAEGTLTVSPGNTLQVNVGGKPTGATGGWNGGGAGGTGESQYGGGGGGASDIRLSTNTNSDGRLLVAGGGGGGGLNNSMQGGHGGGTTGYATAFVLNPVLQDGTAGGGTQSAGGAGGQGYAWSFPQCVTNGNAGSYGQGGNGVYNHGSNCGLYVTGGGGGGWYGGGSGASSGWSGSAPGAGGSGYTGGVSGGSMQDGIRTGHGQIIISW